MSSLLALSSTMPSDVDAFEVAVVRYMFKLDNVTDFGARIRELCGTSSIEIRRNLNNNGYVMRDLKLWLYDAAQGGRSRILRTAEEFGIDASDIRVCRVFKDADTLNRLRELHVSHAPISPSDLQSAVTHCLDSVRDYAMKYVRSKLRFICKSEHIEPEDFALELMGNCVAGIYAQYPRLDSTLHAINVCKRIIKNMGTNIIKRYTTEGRAVLVRNQDGTFSSNKCSYDLMFDNVDADHQDNQHHPVLDEQERIHLRMSVEHLLSKYNEGGAKHTLMRLLMGPDVQFTQWLYDQEIITSGDNEDLHDSCLRTNTQNDYLIYCAMYLGTDDQTIQRYLRHFAYHLGVAA
jgi:hypothetical protein